jgi:hypothetical protein
MLQHEESISDALHALGNSAMKRQHRVNFVAYKLTIVYNQLAVDDGVFCASRPTTQPCFDWVCYSTGKRNACE